jgi:hypothetical protein
LTATVEDVRALWLNPAGLVMSPEASIMAEAVAELPSGGNARLAQWTVAFNSRGVALGYVRNRLRDDPATLVVDPKSTEEFRIGLGLPFHGGAVGGSFTLHNGSAGTDKGGNVGLRLRPRSRIDVGLLLRDIGRPRVLGVRVPLSGVLGVAWAAVPRHLQVAVDATATEQLSPASGIQMAYRAGARLSTGGTLPLGGLVTAALADNLHVVTWSFGLSLGRADRLVAVGTVLPPSIGGRLDRLSLAGVASRALGR